ncbi:hypothetical protein SASPL_156646 [Salvia splendens]|uniref:Uncharacterized protein n=1 Tax=Salvia splendens TaxID=180675 RepID=A0A8X8YWT0_SALSN|nr:hypothetical protein SASPL_156646 [Salvia splendens]
MAACLRSLLLFSCLAAAFVALAFGEEALFPTLQTSEREGDFLEQVNTTLILAEKRTQRKDPLMIFANTEEAGISSVAYTAVPFFIVGAIWFVVFGLCLIITCLYFCCCRKAPYGYSRVAYALSLILLTFFTIAAIIGCIILYTGQGKFHTSTINTLEYVVYQADTTSESLRNVSGYLAAAKQINVDQVILPPNEIGSHHTLCRYAFLTFLGFVFSIFGMQVLVYLLVVTGWILVTGTFILCGIFLLLHNVTGDTCVAMNQWVQNPTAHTALDDILPCVDNATAQETLTKSKEVTSQLVTLMNTVISNISNANNVPNLLPLYFNQSGPSVPNVCNPFNPDLTSRACAPGRLTPAMYTQMAASVNVSYGLYKYGPFLANVQDCSFVRDTFSAIEADHCPGLRRYSKWIYVGLVMVALAVMLSLLFWVIYGRERRHRVYTKAHTPRGAPGFEEDKHA